MRLYRIAAAVALSAGLAGCGACEDDVAPESSDGTRAAAPAEKKVFHFYRMSAEKSLDPVKQFEAPSAYILQNVYDTLLRYHYLKRPYELEPALLTKMPELSADGLTYSFELRDDVRFIDDPCFPDGKGRTLVADDVIYSIKRFADANQNVKSYTLWRGAVAGLDEFRERTKALGKSTDYAKLEISGIERIDARHFTITLTEKNPLALYPLAATQFSIVAHEAVEHYGDRFAEHPVGTGPFKLTQYSRRGVTILTKNEHYYETYPSEGAPGDREKGLLGSAGAKLPFIDEVRLPLIEEVQPRMLRFLNGDTDWIGFDKANFAKMAYKDDKGFHLKPAYEKRYAIYAEPSLTSELFVFNTKDPLLGKNKALREAIAYALDTKSFVDQMRNGRGEPLGSLVPLTIRGNEKDIGVTAHAFDLGKARQKLKEAGYPEGKGLPPITIEYPESTTYMRNDHEFNRAQLAKVGITLEPSYQTFSTHTKKLESGNFQLTWYAWGADFPDAENFYQLLYSKNAPPGPNYGDFSNPEYDRLYEESRRLENGPERFALFKRMSEIIRREVPIVLRWTRTIVGMHQPWVRNFKRNMMIDTPFRYLDIDNAARAKGHD